MNGEPEQVKNERAEADGREGSAPEAEEKTVLSDSGESSLLGLRIDNYELLEELGHGAFGRVYRARDTKLDRDVALKFLRDTMEPLHRKLFEREAKAIAALGKHPAIVQIHGWGEYNEHAYFALEYMPGSVEKQLRRRSRGLELPEALRIMVASAQAIEFAHNEGVLHRDIKPENILLDEKTGQIKIADFGLASFYESAGTTLLAGAVCGSPPYMAPEQASGHPADRRSDVFSLGATLYRLLCGKPSVEGSSTLETLERVRNNERVPLRQRRPELREDLVQVVEKAMAFKPGDRYQTAGEFAKACQAILDSIKQAGNATTLPITPPQTEQPPKQPAVRRVSGRAVVLLAAAVIAALLLGIWHNLRSDNSTPSNVVQADQLLDRGDAPAAEVAYRACLDKQQDDRDALAGLGYALLLQDKYPEAASSFTRIPEQPLQKEGLSAVAFYQKDAAARQALEEAAKEGASAFPKVLLGTLDLVDGQYDKVVERLEQIKRDQVRFAWQFDRCLQSLGQAYYHQNNLDRALAVFQQLSQAKSPAAASVANAYLDRVAREADAARRDANVKAMQTLRDRLDEMHYTPKTDEELWTSRPLRFFILPPTLDACRYAAESGLGDFLPDLLGQAIKESGARIDWVDREELGVLLAEQELAAFVGKENDVALGRVLGARLIVKNSFRSLMAEELLATKVVDAETTELITAFEVPLARQSNPRDVVKAVADEVAHAIPDEYPLRGRLTSTDGGFTINIGHAVGVRTGMRFVIAGKPDPRAAIAALTATVQGTPGTEDAKVAIEGTVPGNIPEGGLYVLEEGWYKEHAAPSS